MIWIGGATIGAACLLFLFAAEIPEPENPFDRWPPHWPYGEDD